MGGLHRATWGGIGMGELRREQTGVAALGYLGEHRHGLPGGMCLYCGSPPPCPLSPPLSLLPWAWPWYPYPSPPCPLSSPPQSAALGLAMAGAIALGYANIFVTAPSPENLKTLFEFVTKVRRGTGGRWGRRKVGWCKIGCVWPMWPSRWSVCGQCGLQDGACEANVAYSV